MNKKHFIVTVKLTQLDETASETGSIAKVYVPTIADNEEDAAKRAVVFHSDGGEATCFPNGRGDADNAMAECLERDRWLLWTAVRCLAVSEDEFNTFLTLTDGLTTTTVCQ